MENNLIDRQAAIDALDGNVIVTRRESAQAVMDYIRGCADRIRSLPPAKPDLDSAYTEGYTQAEAKYRVLLDDMKYTRPETIRCKDCKHRIKISIDIFPNVFTWGCNYMDAAMGDNDFCSKGERRTDETTI